MDYTRRHFRMSTSDARRFVKYASKRGGDPLFPNLHSLESHIRRPSDAHLLGILVGPRLSHVILRCSRPDVLANTRGVITESLHLYPLAIKHVDIDTYEAQLDLPRLIQPMKSLEELTVRDPACTPSELATALFGAKSFRKIWIEQTVDTPWLPSGLHVGPDDPFVSLQQADVGDAWLPSILSSSTSPSKLHSLSFDVWRAQDDVFKSVRDGIRLVGQTCLHLQKLKITVGRRSLLPELNTPINLSIRPLLQLRDLRELSVFDTSGTLVPAWNEEGTEALATSWPRLSTLTWRSKGSAGSNDLSVLSMFSSCDTLLNLRIPVNASIPVSKVLKPFTRTVSLNVGEWIITPQSIDRITDAIASLRPIGTAPLQLCGYAEHQESGLWWEAVQRKLQCRTLFRPGS